MVVVRTNVAILLALLTTGCGPGAEALPEPIQVQHAKDIAAQAPPDRTDAIDVLIATLRAGAGDAQLECGRFWLPKGADGAGLERDVDRAIECIKNAARSGQPAWMVAEQQGLDSLLAQGLRVGSGGRIERFTYDSYGGFGQTDDCARPSARVNRSAVTVQCDTNNQ